MGSHTCLKLPPGFRFHPTDEELVTQYLKRRVFSIPLPASIITDIDLCKYDPWDLPGDEDGSKYFFTRKEAKYPSGNRSNRACASGYWKATGKDRSVHSTRGNQVVGMKKSLVFYRGKAPKGSKTEWIMHEYRLTEVGAQPYLSLLRKNSVQVSMEDWVLCRIFIKKSSQRLLPYTEGTWIIKNQAVDRPIYIDFMMEKGRMESKAPSETSGVTQVSSSEACDTEDGVSSCRRFF